MMQVNIIRKPAPIDKVQIELSEKESFILTAMLESYFRNLDPGDCHLYNPDYCFLKELLDKLLWKRI